MEPLTISCNECCLDGTAACDDCVLSFLLCDDVVNDSPVQLVPRSSNGALIVDAAEARAMRLLHSAGLVPTLRFERRVG